MCVYEIIVMIKNGIKRESLSLGNVIFLTIVCSDLLRAFSFSFILEVITDPTVLTMFFSEAGKCRRI